MKRTVAIWLALIAGSAMLAAQAIDQYQPRKFDSQAAQTPSTPKVDFRVLKVPVNPACPVAFTAKQGGMGDWVAVSPGHKPEPPNGISQHISLSVAPGKGGASVVNAQVTVHGLTPKARVVPVQSGPGGPAQISRTMHVSFSNNSAGESAADLLMRGYSAVVSIDIDSITYADGSTWKSGKGMCRVIPDPMMLIGAR